LTALVRTFYCMIYLRSWSYNERLSQHLNVWRNIPATGQHYCSRQHISTHG